MQYLISPNNFLSHHPCGFDIFIEDVPLYKLTILPQEYMPATASMKILPHCKFWSDEDIDRLIMFSIKLEYA